MVAISVTPFAMQNAKLTIGADNYEAVVSAAELVPTTPTVTFKGIGAGAVAQIVGSPQWVLNLTFAQDLATAKSLTNYLNANVGLAVDFTLTPVAGGAGRKVNAVIQAVNIGGAVDALASSTTSLPVNGQPTIVTAA